MQPSGRAPRAMAGLLACCAAWGGGACRARGTPGEVLAAGHVEATEVRVATKVAGRVQSLRVREGDVVQAGQELARLDDTDLRLARRQAQAELEQARAELSLKLAGARAEDVAEADAHVRSAQADARAAQRDLERAEGLLERGSGTAKVRDDARARRDATQARLEAGEQVLRRLRAGFRAEEKLAARARVGALEARLAQIDQQLADCVVQSPRGGVVSEKLVEAGELLAPGGGVLLLTDLGDAWLTAYVAETDVPRLRLGQPAQVTTDDGQVRPGRVSKIASRAEFTPRNVQTRDERVKLVYEVRITLDNADGLFKPGMPAEARLAAAPPAGSAP